MTFRHRTFRGLIPAFGLALVASLALAVVGAASASAAFQHWYSCKNVGAGKGVYEDSACSKEGGTKAFSWSKLALGSPTGFTMKGTTSFNLKWKLGGLPFAITCSTQSSEGTIENPKKNEGESAGLASVSPGQLSGCTLTEPAASGCKVENGKITTFSLKGENTEFEGKPAVKFSSPGGNWLFGVTLTGCSEAFKAFNAYYSFSGSFTGIASNATSSLEFTKASSAILIGGNSVTLEGTSKLETKAGEALKVAP